MENNKNFITAIVLTILIIFFYPLLMKKMFPQHFPSAEQQTSQEAVSSINQPETMRPAIRNNDITYNKLNSYVILNNLYKVIVNAPGADIKRIELNAVADPATGGPTVIMDTNDMFAGIFSTKELLQNTKLEKVKTGDSSLEFTYLTGNDLYISKTIFADENMFKLGMSINIENRSSSTQLIPYQLVAATGLPQAQGIESRFQNVITYYDENKQFKKNPGSVKELKTVNGDVKLGGIVSRYFSLIVSPLSGADYFYTFNQEYGNVCGIGKNNLSIEPGETIKHHYVLYAGPNSHEDMSALNLGIEQVRGKGFFAGFSDLLLLMLRWLYMILKNYGLAVIALALTINLFLYPLTFKSLKSMKEMQALQPMVEKIREQYKDNPEKLNKEIMELYKKHKVNPAGGCLPMLLQMPVFFSLYGVLMRAIELRGADFLWIKDLAAPDALFTFSSKMPFIGDSFNLLPILMVVLTFLQQKLTSPSQGNDQQKAMMFMMPIFLGFIFYGFPSGLVLYFLTNSIFSFFVQVKLSKQFEQQLAVEKA